MHTQARIAAIELGLFLLGLVLLSVLFVHLQPYPSDAFTLRRAALLVLAAWVGLVLRGTRRKAFYGDGVGWHQSFAFEVVVQCVQFLSPLVHRRAFELEFTSREAPAAATRANGWYDARALTFAMALPVGMGAMAFFLGQPGLGIAFLLLAGAVLAIGMHLVSYRLRCLLGVALALVTFGVEGQLVVWAVGDYVDPRTMWVAYILFTGLAEVALVPGALGMAELPALWGGAPVFVALVSFHAARLGILVPLGFVYLPRFKFTFRDLYNPRLLARMRETRRRGAEPRTDAEGAPNGPLYSVVIPAYNEEHRLPAYLERIKSYIDRRPETFEVLVVDDGSRDRTAEVVLDMVRRDDRFRLLRQPQNAGKGAAVRRGVLESSGQYALFADADGATPIRELERFMPVQEAADIVIGSRAADAPGVRRNRDRGRRLMGSVFYKLANVLALPGISDPQCGFKMLRRDVAQAIFPHMLENHWAFDVEMLYLAQRMGFVVAEVGVNWQDIGGSKVHPVRDSLRMLVGLFRIRWRHAGHASERPAV